MGLRGGKNEGTPKTSSPIGENHAISRRVAAAAATGSLSTDSQGTGNNGASAVSAASPQEKRQHQQDNLVTLEPHGADMGKELAHCRVGRAESVSQVAVCVLAVVCPSSS